MTKQLFLLSNMESEVKGISSKRNSETAPRRYERQCKISSSVTGSGKFKDNGVVLSILPEIFLNSGTKLEVLNDKKIDSIEVDVKSIDLKKTNPFTLENSLKCMETFFKTGKASYIVSGFQNTLEFSVSLGLASNLSE